MVESLLLSLSVAGCFLFTLGVLAAAAAHALGVAIARGVAPILTNVRVGLSSARPLRTETGVAT